MRSLIGLLLLLTIFVPAQILAQNSAMKKQLDVVIERAVEEVKVKIKEKI